MAKSKTCFKCHIEKPLDSFYKHPMMADGRLGKCKDCAKEDVRQNYSARRDRYLEYEKKRNKTEHRKRQLAKNGSAYNNRFPERCRAVQAVYRAIKAGRLGKPEACSACHRVGRVEGHHHDYANRLDVVWLCRSCHRRIHAASP